jgi:hypothetical protein
VLQACQSKPAAIVRPGSELGQWLARERQALFAVLGREVTRREFLEHSLERYRADPHARAVAIAARP